ncbi:MAG: DUF1887 family protein [Candidatus Cloacimonetes bacterium]|nr:DUF1887 family protein [Candidatus Cloacimonadota bacterium]
MKKYLMTWYGVTDFRASLGLEQTSGPVLRALLAEDYTDVVLLGFTRHDRSENQTAWFQQRKEGIDGFEPAVTSDFIDLFSNSVAAHNYFTDWLKTQLRDANKKVDLHFHSVGLKHLNDTEGIYDAATQTLHAVATSEGEKLVTLYLSPGTPVMAFVWAFAALRHPNLKKRLIASSQPGKPPERIALPSEWLEWHGRQVGTTNLESNQYDVIFHMFGEQRLPNLLGVVQFSSKKHIFLTSSQFPAAVMKQFLGDAEYGEIAINPYDPSDVRSKILDSIAKLPVDMKIGFNLTGGTKLMYAGALAACRNVNATPFYFDSRNSRVLYLNDFKSIPTKLISSVETFIQLNGNNLVVSTAGHWDEVAGSKSVDRIALTKLLWDVRYKISKMYDKLSSYSTRRNAFELHHRDIYIKHCKNGGSTITIGKKHFEFENWPDFARYLVGGWFEEYVYLSLLPLVESGLIKDMRIGLKVSLKEDAVTQQAQNQISQPNKFAGEYQELDVVLTDGRRLYIIECKAGAVNSENVMKIQNVVRLFGGGEGRAAIASCFPPNNNVVKKKINDSKNLRLVAGDQLANFLQKRIRSGEWHK